MFATGASAGRKMGSNEQASVPQDRSQSLRPGRPEGMLRFQTKKRRKELPNCHPLCTGQHQLQNVQGTWLVFTYVEFSMCE